MSYQKKDGADAHKSGGGINKKDTRGQNGSSTAFRTDSAISGNRSGGHRELQPWKPDADVDTKTFGTGLESSSNGGHWDQFAANEKLFGLKSDYNETFYTTEINKNAPDYAAKVAAAERKAREIEKSTPTNAHIREERTMDHSGVDDSGKDEEDKYSGVLESDFPPLASGDKSNRYVAPARRPPTGQATVKGAPVDPAIISSQLARPKPAAEPSKSTTTVAPVQATPVSKDQLSTPPAVSTAKFAAVTPDAKLAPSNPPNTASRTASPNTRPLGTPNATATVERDLASAFKSFASQQRTNVEKIRTSKLKADKESKLSDLKKFSETFKLNSPVPTDLVPIIAKDPAKQREIQEKSKRNAEQQEKEKQAKLASEASVAPSPASESKSVPKATIPPPGGPSSTTPQGRSNATRGQGGPPQAQYNNQSFRGAPMSQGNQAPAQQSRAAPGPGALGSRLRAIEQNKDGRYNGPTAMHENRPPPTGPANGVDANFSRRSSGAASMAKLNPNTQEFRPNAFAPAFNPTSNPSSTSSPRTGSISVPIPTQAASPAGSLMRKKLKATAKPFVSSDFDILAKIKSEKPPTGKEKAWAANGGVQPAFETVPTWKSLADNEPPSSTMHLTYAQMIARSSMPTMSPSQTHSVNPVAHQHQLPFHLQQGAHSMGPRNTPRQPALHGQNHMHGPNGHFNNGDDHRMMPSHSAQSFASPRLQQVNMASYQSPMGQPSQIVYQQNNGMQFPMGGPQTPQMSYRSYSGGPQFIPQQQTQMGGPVMIPGPGPNGFMPGMQPGPQMIYPQGQFIPGPPPMMPGANGYPSPGRGGAPMMMQQGSQQGHQTNYGMSPGLQYGQPVYNQPPPGQMPNMRGYPQGQQQFSTSPQMNHQFNHHQNRGPSGNFNKNYHPQQNQHAMPPQGQAQAGPQSKIDGADEAK